MAGLDDDNALAFWIAEEKTTAAQQPKSKATHSTEVQELFKLDSRFVFTVKYMGRVVGARRQGSDIIDFIDEQRQFGNVAHIVTAQDAVQICLTRYGLKVTDVNEEEVFHRIPFHRIGSVTYYIEDTKENVIVVETGAPDSGSFVYYLYQVDTEDEASRICTIFGKAFQLLQINMA
eukprot:m.69129 g.69129  ORF g.69129 m.69129 type:complete len:176 (-) comp13716_c0_seq1:232-759(-)